MLHLRKIKCKFSIFTSIFLISAILLHPALIFADELVELDESNINQDPPVDASDIADGTYQGLTSSSNAGVSRETDDRAISVNKFASADKATGAFLYDYNFNIPKGRNNLTPEFSLAYNSNDKSNDSIVGYGWSIDIPSIKRINKNGSDKLYSSSDFTSSLSGELVRNLAENNLYNSKIENGDFLKYMYNDDGSWAVVDKIGTKYTFGKDPNARKDNPDNGGHIYEWMLEEVRDINDNFIRYEYFKDKGQIYPSKIYYTGHGSTDGIFEIIFNREDFIMSPRMYYSAFEVRTNYRIKDIEVLQNGQWIQKYKLDYSSADNGQRQLLSSVIESGRDLASNQVLTKNPTEFSYKKRGSVKWVEDPNWKLPYHIGLEGYTQSTNLAQLRDINGDSYPDLVLAQRTNNPECEFKKVWINNGNGSWTVNTCPTQWYMGPYLYDRSPAFKDTGYRILDYNGDYRNDLVHSFSYQDGKPSDFWNVWDNVNNISANWKYDMDKKVPIGFVFGSGMHADNATQVLDINGDGIADVVRGWLDDDQEEIAPLVLEEKAFIGDGEKWIEETDTNKWNLPWGIVDENVRGKEMFTFAQFIDLNGDGLVDYAFRQASSGSYGNITAINNGYTWNRASEWVPLNNTQLTKNAETAQVDGGMRSFDANGDGLIDMVISRFNNQNNNISSSVYMSTRDTENHGFISDPNAEELPLAFAWEMGSTTHNIIADINADGIDDLIQADLVARKGFNPKTYIAQAHPFTDMLAKVKTPEGATSDISYKMSTQYFDSNGKLLNPNLQIAVTTVEKIETDDGLGNKSKEEYVYRDGHYYYKNPQDRKFAGFGVVEKKDAIGNLVKTYYHQGNDTNSSLGEYQDHSSKIGKIYREEFYDNTGKLYKKVIHKWDNYEISPDRNFVKETSTISYTHDGNLNHRDIAEEFVYDNNNGNLKEKIEYGEVSASDFGSFVDIGTDKKNTIYNYATDPNNIITGAPMKTEVYDYNSNKVSEIRLYYDNQSLGVVLKGNKTKDSKWVSGSIYSDSNYQYNSYGLIDYTYDHYNKNQTNYTYDAFNMYPSKITNHLSQDTTFEYNYLFGQPTKIINPNGSVTEKQYDSFGRPVSEFAPDPQTGTLVEKKVYSYNDTYFPNSITEKVNLSVGLSTTGYKYIDGFGRTIQTKTEAENGFVTFDFVYDNLGNLIKESLPYLSNNSSYSTPATNSNLLKMNSYDALGRIISISDVSGIITNKYNLWSTQITDQLGNDKVYENDAYGNLITVKEAIAPGTFYTTFYSWDTNSNLIKITDAEGNIRRFSYDALGNRTLAEDLHLPSDPTYGIYLYAYDLAGNLKSYQTPSGDSVTYAYDNINRVISEDSNTTSGIEVVYNYDFCTNGVGYVCQIITNSVSDTYEYTKDGKIRKELRSIGTSSFNTEYLFDYQGNVIEIKNPDDSFVRYAYNHFAKIDSIDYKKDITSIWSPVILNIDYSPTGQVEKKVSSNGITTTYDFDDTNLYRLKNIKSIDGLMVSLQDISYTYDRVGNVVEINDASSNIASKKAVYTYDNLYRLASATITNTGNLADYTQTFSYSPIGNILSKSDNTGTYQYNGSVSVGNYANPHAITNVGTKSYSYDKNGNLISGTSVGNNTWDYRNRLQISHLGPANIVSYDYDNSNQRVKYQHGVDTVLYPNKFYNIKNGTSSTKHIFSGNDVIATIERVGPTENIFYNHEDHLNSSSVITNSTGAIDQTLDYYPYGTIRINDKKSNFDEQRKFTSHEHDASTGLDYMRARYYDSIKGQFVSQDAMFWNLPKEYLLDPQQQNSYAYARNNPIRYVDPTGNNIFHGPWLEKESPYIIPYLETNITVAQDNSDGYIFVDKSFAGTLDKVNTQAKNQGLTLEVFSDFRSDQSSLANLYVDKPAPKSNHMIGQAIDHRIIFNKDGQKCNGDCIKSYLSSSQFSEKGNSIKSLYKNMKIIDGLRTGDTISVKKSDGTKTYDYPHLDSGLNVRNPSKYDSIRKKINK